MNWTKVWLLETRVGLLGKRALKTFNTIQIVNSFFLPYSTIVLFNINYLATHKEAKTMASASNWPWPWRRQLPCFASMAPPRRILRRCIEQHKARLAHLKIGCSGCNNHLAAASESVSTVQAVSAHVLPDTWAILLQSCDHNKSNSTKSPGILSLASWMIFIYLSPFSLLSMDAVTVSHRFWPANNQNYSSH